MTTYTVINDFTPEAKKRFLDEMRERIKDFDNWDDDAVCREVFEQASEAIDAGNSILYELSQFHTISRHTELLSFEPEDFISEQRPIDQE